MPRFDIREQQSILNPRRITSEQTGAAVARGMQAVGQAVSGVSEEIERYEQRQRKVELNSDLNSAAITWAEKENELAERYPTGDGMADAWQAEWNEFASSFNEKYRGDEEAQIKLDNLRRQFGTRIVNQQASYRAQHQVQSFREDRDIISTKVAKGEMDYEFALNLLNDRTDALAGINPNARGQIAQENQDMIGYAAISDTLDAQGFIAADELIDSDQFENLSASTRSSLKSKIRSEAGVYVRRETRQAAQLLDAGYPVGDLTQEIETAERFGFDDQALQLQTIQQIQQEVNEFVLQPSAENRNRIREIDRKMLSGEIDDTDLALITALRGAYNTKRKMLATDPYTWLDRSGWNGEPITFGDPSGDMSGHLEQRRAIRSKVLEQEGVDIPLLRPEEVASFHAAISQSSPEEQVGLISNLTNQLEGEEIGFTANQLAPKDITLAAAMVNAQFAPDVTRDIILGRSRDVPVPNDTAFQAEFLDVVGLAIEDEDARQQAMEAVKAVYKEYGFRSGEADSAGIDSSVYKQSIERVIGPLVSFGKNKTLSFRDDSGEYVEAEVLEDIMDDVTEDDFMAVYGDTPRSISGRPLDIEKMFDNMDVVAVGDGIYAFRNNLGQFATTETGEEFQMDMRQMVRYYRNKPMAITGSRRRER